MSQQKKQPIIVTARSKNTVAAIVYDAQVAAYLMSLVKFPTDGLDDLMVVVSNKANGMSATVPVRVAAQMLGLDLPPAKNGHYQDKPDDKPAAA